MTSAMAFFIGSLSTFQGMESFGVFAGFSVIFAYFYVLTYYAAVLTYDVRRQQAGRADCCGGLKCCADCCRGACTPSAERQDKREFDIGKEEERANRFVRFYVNAVTHGKARFVIVALFFTMAATSIYSMLQLEVSPHSCALICFCDVLSADLYELPVSHER